jgi:hypothetical protein
MGLRAWGASDDGTFVATARGRRGSHCQNRQCEGAAAKSPLSTPRFSLPVSAVKSIRSEISRIDAATEPVRAQWVEDVFRSAPELVIDGAAACR